MRKILIGLLAVGICIAGFVYCTSRGQDSREHLILERIGRQIIYEIPMEWEWSSEENRHYYQTEVDGESIYLTMLLYNQGEYWDKAQYIALTETVKGDKITRLPEMEIAGQNAYHYCETIEERIYESYVFDTAQGVFRILIAFPSHWEENPIQNELFRIAESFSDHRNHSKKAEGGSSNSSDGTQGKTSGSLAMEEEVWNQYQLANITYETPTSWVMEQQLDTCHTFQIGETKLELIHEVQIEGFDKASEYIDYLEQQNHPNDTFQDDVKIYGKPAYHVTHNEDATNLTIEEYFFDTPQGIFRIRVTETSQTGDQIPKEEFDEFLDFIVIKT